MILKSISLILCQQWLLIVQCCLFLILNVLDGHSTWLVPRPNFYHRERNPIARWAFKKIRLPRAIPIFKAVLLTCLGIIVAGWWKETLTLNIALGIGNLLFLFVVWHNYRVVKHYRKQQQWERDVVWQITRAEDV